MSMLQAMVDGVSTEDQINHLAEKLSRIHGTVSIRHESSGTHLTMACPHCLKADGRKELKSKHLQVNADKFLGIGKYKQKCLPHMRDNPKVKKGYAQCMKEHGPMSMNQIESWEPLEERGVLNTSPLRVVDSGKTRYLVPDDHGVMIPDHPGKTIPLNALPADHPASVYLKERDYDATLLFRQFRAAWCYAEAPEGEQFNRWYRKHGWGWKSTPQGRIVFYCDVAGAQHCWQARYLSIMHEGQELLWHPYNEGWESRPPWPEKEGPVKYMTASSAQKSNVLCGFDAVRLAKLARREERPVCVLTEGPLDAARFPDRGMAVLGKSLSDAQAILVAGHFRRVILAFDADAPGASACVSAAARLAEHGVQTQNFFTAAEQQSDGKLDAGMMGYQACEERLRQLMHNFD